MENKFSLWEKQYKEKRYAISAGITFILLAVIVDCLSSLVLVTMFHLDVSYNANKIIQLALFYLVASALYVFAGVSSLNKNSTLCIIFSSIYAVLQLIIVVSRMINKEYPNLFVLFINFLVFLSVTTYISGLCSANNGNSPIKGYIGAACYPLFKIIYYMISLNNKVVYSVYENVFFFSEIILLPIAFILTLKFVKYANQ